MEKLFKIVVISLYIIGLNVLFFKWFKYFSINAAFVSIKKIALNF